MFKTRKNNLTMEDGHKLRNMIAGLSGPQQMTVIEILRENKEHLAQDEEGNVEMEFREFNQKSIDDLKSYVLSVTTSNQKQPGAGGGKDLSGGGAGGRTGVHPGGGGKDMSGGKPGGGKDLSGAHNTTNDSEDSDSDDSSSSESSSDSDSD